jgi:hypothetical protein
MTDLVAVTRSGGITGRRVAGEVRLGEDLRSDAVEELLGRIDLAALPVAQPQPDRYVYTFGVDGAETVVGEQDLTPDLEELARLVLGT